MFKTAANVDTIYIRPIIMLPKPKVGKHVHITKLYVFGFNYIRCLFVWFGHVYSFKKKLKILQMLSFTELKVMKKF